MSAQSSLIGQLTRQNGSHGYWKMIDISSASGIHFPRKSMQRIWHQTPAYEEKKAEADQKLGSVSGVTSFKKCSVQSWADHWGGWAFISFPNKMVFRPFRSFYIVFQSDQEAVVWHFWLYLQKKATIISYIWRNLSNETVSSTSLEILGLWWRRPLKLCPS